MNPSDVSSPGLENSQPATTVRWRIVALLVAYSFMSWFNRLTISIAYDERIKNQLGISEEAMGTIYSTFFFSYTICMTPGGWFIDRFGPKVALVAMGLGSGVFGALTGLAGLPAVLAAGMVLPTFFIMRLLMGVFSAPVYPASGRAISFWIHRGQRTLANGLVQGGAAVGMACAFPIFGTLMDTFDWPLAFMFSGLFTIVLALVWTWYAADSPALHASVNDAELHCIGNQPLWSEKVSVSAVSPTPKWWHLFRNRSLVLLTLNYSAVGYIEYLFFFWMHYYFENVLKLGKEESRTYSAILFLSFATGMVGGGWLTDRIQSVWGHGRGRKWVPMLGMMSGALFLWLGLLGKGETEIVACLAIALGSVGACEATVWTTAIELGGRQGGTAAAICNTGGNLLGLVSPMLTPVVSKAVIVYFGVSELAGWQWGISLGSGICLAGALLWFWIDTNER